MIARRRRAVGVDIGGTKIAAASVAEPGEVQRRLRCATPRSGAAAVLAAVAELVAELAGDASLGPVAGVGVGSPGVIDELGGSVSAATQTLPNWAGAPVRAELESILGLPVSVDNDVRMLARAELALGAATGSDDALFLSVGTGIGGALALGGRIVRGPHGTAGELAHLVVPAEGVIACGCGRRDHLEACVSGPAIAARYSILAARHSALAGREDTEPVAVPEIVARMRSGDLAAREAIEGAAVLLGRALAGLLAAVDVEVLVVGGGVGQIGADFLEPMVVALRAELLPPLRTMDVRAAMLGTDAPVIGAALLACESITRPEGGAGR